jgi:type IV pilus biogenesis protein CpaD/CtpE
MKYGLALVLLLGIAGCSRQSNEPCNYPTEIACSYTVFGNGEHQASDIVVFRGPHSKELQEASRAALQEAVDTWRQY